MKKLFAIILALAMTFALSATALAEDTGDGGTIKIVVTTSDGSPINGIVFTAAAEGADPVSGTTGADGKATIELTANGTYTVATPTIAGHVITPDASNPADITFTDTPNEEKTLNYTISANNPPTKGTITIQNPVVDTTYKAFKIFDVTINSATPTTFSYTIKDDSDWYTAVNTYANMPEAPETTDDNTDGLTLTAITGTANPTEYLVEVTDDFDAGDFAASMKTALTNMTNPDPDAWRGPVTASDSAPYQLTTDGEEPTAMNGQVDLGYYLVVTYTAGEGEGADPVMGAAVSLDTTSPNAAIIDKNAPTPGFDNNQNGMGKRFYDVTEGTTEEWVQHGEAEIGAILDFRIRLHLPVVDGTNMVDTYTITDVIKAGFEYSDSLTVTAYPDSSFSGTGVSLHTATATTNGVTVAEPDADNSQTMTITLKPGNIANYPGNAYVEITFKLMLDSDAEFETTNTANLKWTCVTPAGAEQPPAPSYEGDRGLDSTTFTYTVGFPVGKTMMSEDGQTEVLMPETIGHAIFSLYRQETDGEPIALVDITPEEASNIPSRLPNGLNDTQVTATKWYRVAKAGERNTVTTFPAGYTVIFGLDADVDYWLEETDAPDGYNPLTTRQKVELPNQNENNQNGYTPYTYAPYEEAGQGEHKTGLMAGEKGDEYVGILNQKGGELPSVGGIGTTIFYVIGGLLMVGAVVLLVVRKKMSVME